MPDYKQGVKKDVSEIKFLIHDLRVERFIDEVIHFHVTLDTDLQLHGIADPLVITGDDLRKLRTRAATVFALLASIRTSARRRDARIGISDSDSAPPARMTSA